MNHRRPSHDELTPEDLFRPEPSPGATIPGEVVRSTEMPWNAQPGSPQAQQPEYFGDPAQPTQSYQQSYGPPVEEASTQFMPPFPAAQPPEQPYGQQAAPTQAYGGYPAAQAPTQPPAPVPVGSGAGSRFSPKAIGITVVAACAVLGIGVAAVLSSGGSGSAAAAGTHPSASGSAVRPVGDAKGGSAADPAQAKALSDLLATASNSRTAVISAVGSIEHCQNLDQAAENLTTAAGLRGHLVDQLSALQTDRLPQGTALVEALRQGWTASQSADAHYAAWAKASKNSCDHKHHPADGAEKAAGAAASSDATIAKQKASRLWDAIAGATGLPKRASTQL